MQNAEFHPSTKQGAGGDKVASGLTTFANGVLVLVLGLFPVLFLPVSFAPQHFTKIMFVLAGVLLALVCHTLAALRKGGFSLTVPWALLGFWGVAAAYAASTIFSGDIEDSLFGDTFSPNSTAFVCVMALIMSVLVMMRSSKRAIISVFSLLMCSGVFLGVFHLFRAAFGADALTFGIFQGAVTTPYGSWNGLAIFSGLIVLIGIVAFQELKLSVLKKALIGFATILALAILAIVNFYAIWIALAGISLVALVYNLLQKQYAHAPNAKGGGIAAIAVSVLVLIVSLSFAIAGSTIGNVISTATGISYVEVRPSHTATLDILKQVYGEVNAVTGIGANKFVDAWRMYKNPAINETIFWSAPFESGSGYLPTSFVTTGFIGVAAWAVFLLALLGHAVRMFRKGDRKDQGWGFIGVASFVATAYLWGVAIIYTPSATTMLLTATVTGIFLAAYSVLVPRRKFEFSFFASRAAGVVLVGIAVFVIIGSAGVLYVTGQRYAAIYTYLGKGTFQEGTTLDQMQERVVHAYARSSNDLYARDIAVMRMLQMDSFLASADGSSETNRQEFQAMVTQAIDSARLATAADPTEPLNWIVLGQVYSMLTFVSVEGAYERAVEAYDLARVYDPQNPAIVLLRAQLESRRGEMEIARQFADESIRMKPNYIEALHFLSQIDIVEGKVADAIARVRATTVIEPANPARHYQLGVLLVSTKDLAPAISAFERAIELDPQFANARYFLSLAYAETGDYDRAIEQMRVVEELNPDNADVKQIIGQLESGQPVSFPGVSTETQPAVTDGQEVTEENLEDTSLVSSVNTLPEEANADAEGEAE